MTEDDLVPPASPLAKEIAARFSVLMARGGRVDQILAGGIGERAPGASDKEIAFRLHDLEAQLAEYRAAQIAAIEWYAAWKARQPKGFRALRRRQ